jgi:hypothetical protein
MIKPELTESSDEAGRPTTPANTRPNCGSGPGPHVQADGHTRPRSATSRCHSAVLTPESLNNQALTWPNDAVPSLLPSPTAIMSLEKRANAIDHSHHLSDLARRYDLSPLKGLQKYYGKDLIPFAGGALIYHSPVRAPYFTSCAQACPVPNTSPTPPSRPTSSPQTRSH